jgi:hypothetical protein
MRFRTIAIGGLSAGAILGGIALLAVAGERSPKRASKRVDDSAQATESKVTVVHKHVVVEETSEGGGQPPRSADALVEQASGTEPTARTHEEALFEMEQQFEAAPANRTLEGRNEQVLRGVLARVSGGAALPVESFACRGASCRLVFDFESVEQARATLNVMPDDEAWQLQRFGFNALPENPNDPNPLRLVVYVTGGQATAANP